MSKKPTSKVTNDVAESQGPVNAADEEGTFSYPEIKDAPGPEPVIYQDRHGLPVLYSQDAQPKQTTENDAIRVLWHDLLSPITLIQGYCSTLLDCDDFVTEKQRKSYLQNAISASEKLVHRLEKFRYLFDLEGSCRISPQRIALSDVVRRVCSEVQDRTSDHTVILHRPGQLPKINIDVDKIREVVEILLVNATSLSPEGSDIVVERLAEACTGERQ